MSQAYQSQTLHQAVAGRDVPSLLQHWEANCPDKPFLIWAPFDANDQTWSYREFGLRARKLAQGLRDKGIQTGDRVIIHLDNSPEFVFAWYACALLGAVAVTTNTRSVAADINYFIEKAEAAAAITQNEYVGLFEEKQEQLKFLAVTQAKNPSQLDFDSLYSEQEYTTTEAVRTWEDLSIQFTSGTTSKPKAVVWTHANAVWGAQCNARNLGLQHSDNCQAFLPLFHTNNQSYSLLGSLWVGGSYILQPRFSKTHFWRPALKYKASWASMIPFCVKALAEEAVPEHHFRFWTPAVNLPSLEEHFKLRLFGLYGMTETITQAIVADPVRTGPEMGIGRPSHGYEISIRNEAGGATAPGETGDLYLRGVAGINLFKEYLNDPAATEKSFSDGWFETGDRIQIAEDGELFFADRAKDMLKVGGENVAASEIESVVAQSGFADETAVVGQPHYMLDEVPVVFIIKSELACQGMSDSDVSAAIINHCKTYLADFKVVRDVHIVDELPRSLLNKISKKDLRDRLEEITA